MRVIDCQQGTPEWFNARLGIPTASCFDMIVTTKGEPSKQRTKYLYKLAGEKVSGLQEETYKNDAMLRGSEMEDEARRLYGVMNDNPVSTVGLCLSDCGSYGASPDGLVGDNGGLEIKCPTVPVHVEYLLENNLPSAYFQQVQGQLLVTKREYVDFFSYYPGLRPLVIRVYPDNKFLKALEKELLSFCQELNEVVNKIK